MVAQYQAGFLKDITADVSGVEGHLQPTTVNAFKVDGKVVGVPWDTGAVTFFYNKQLFDKAGVKAEDIKTWDDFLAAVKKIKAAGITPLDVGGGEKWPMHFYYSYLVMRLGGEQALVDAKAGKDGGFKGPTWVKAGEMLRDLAKLEPFQPGYLQTSQAQSAQIFADGKAAIDLMGEWLLGMQASSSTTGKGLPESDIGVMSFPDRSGWQGQGDRRSRRRPRLARHQDRTAGGRRLPQVLQPGEIRERRRGGGRLHPRVRGHCRRHQRSRHAGDRGGY